MNYQKYAVVDIGSNSLRLMTGWQERPGVWTFSKKKLATTRLGQGTDTTHHLSKDGMEASFQAMAAWQKKLTGIPVCAVATSAVREAMDGQAFLAEVRARFGWHCRAISGLEEAALSFGGAAAAVNDKLTAAVIDIGGGSTEVAVGRKQELLWSHSYPMGAVRFSKGEVMASQDISRLSRNCAAAWLPLEQKPEILIGVGGTLTTLAAMDLKLREYDPKQVEGHVVSYAALCRQIEKLQAMTPEQRRHVPGLQPKRSDIIIPGLLIAKSFLEKYQLDAVTVSEKDLMEGVFYRHSFHDAAWHSGARV